MPTSKLVNKNIQKVDKIFSYWMTTKFALDISFVLLIEHAITIGFAVKNEIENLMK